jgi:Recombination endonuclease VII
MTATNMANRREYNRLHGHRESPESRKKSNRKYRIASYGLTQEQFDRLPDAQQHTCGMCHEPFEEGQLIHVDHDHACCRGKNRSCGECVRGLLCHTCNIALGYIEHRYAMARAYLDSPPVGASPPPSLQTSRAPIARLPQTCLDQHDGEGGTTRPGESEPYGQ